MIMSCQIEIDMILHQNVSQSGISSQDRLSQNIKCSAYVRNFPCTDPEVDRGSRPHPWKDAPPLLENHKALGFLSNTVPDPLENHKATCTKSVFNVGPSSARQGNAI